MTPTSGIVQHGAFPRFPEKRSSNRAVEPHHGWSAMNVRNNILVDKGAQVCVWIPSCLGEERWREFAQRAGCLMQAAGVRVSEALYPRFISGSCRMQCAGTNG